MTDTPRTHGAVFAQAAARNLLAQGFAVQEVFGGTMFGPELLEEEVPVYPFAGTAGFFEHAAKLTGDTLFGFKLGQAEDMRSAGLACYAALSAPTAGGFLLTFARYIATFSEAVSADVSRLDSEGIFDWRFRAPPSLAVRQFAEFGAASLLLTLRGAAGGQLTPQRVMFQHTRRRRTHEMADYFRCPVEFGEGRFGFVFDPADLGRPLTTAEPGLLRVLQLCGDQILANQIRQAPGLISEVEQAIAERLASGTVTLDTVSAGLGMSPRTLSRKLSQEGTSFFRLLEDLRKTLAMRYLLESDLMLSEIAFRLGYSGLSSFNDAFKRWTGHSPGQYRSK